MSATGQDNRLLGLRFGAAANALIDIGPQTAMTGGFTFSPPAGSTASTFFVRRVSSGGATVPLTAVDDCGNWRTLVCGEPNVWGGAAAQ